MECARGKGGELIGVCGDNATIWPKVQELGPETKVFSMGRCEGDTQGGEWGRWC